MRKIIATISIMIILTSTILIFSGCNQRYLASVKLLQNDWFIQWTHVAGAQYYFLRGEGLPSGSIQLDSNHNKADIRVLSIPNNTKVYIHASALTGTRWGPDPQPIYLRSNSNIITIIFPYR